MKHNADVPLDDTDKTAIVSGRTNTHRRMFRAKIDPGLYCFTTLAHFHNIPVDPEQITHALAIDPREGMSEEGRKKNSPFLRKSRAINTWYCYPTIRRQKFSPRMSLSANGMAK